MKKNLILFFTIVLVFISCSDNENNKKNPNSNSKLKLKNFTRTYIREGKNSNKEINTCTVEYGENGYIKKITDIDNQEERAETIFTYNDKNQLTKKEYFEYKKVGSKKEYEEITIFTYNKKGLIVSDIDIANYENYYTYNERNQLIKVTDNHSNTSNYEYNDAGKLSKISGSKSSTFTFDDNKNPISSQLPKAYNLIFPEESFNNILTHQNGNNLRKYIHIYSYNKEGYPTKEIVKTYNISDNKLESTSTTEYFYE